MRDFLEQSIHYFSRPHSTIPDGPIASPAAWHGEALRRRTDWIESFDDAEINELETAATMLERNGRPLEDLTVADAPLPTVATRITRWRNILAPQSGRGFVLARGLPVERWSRSTSEIVFWCLGLHIGVPGGQSARNELLGHVRDEGDDLSGATGRAYRTRAKIRFHCDAADVVGLLCLKTAATGGASRIVSSVSVFNVLRAERPDLALRLFSPITLDTRNDAGSVRHVPVQPCCYDRGVLRTFFHSDYYRSATRHPGVVLDDTAQAALDAWEEIAEREAMRLDMQLVPGDVQLLSNHTVVHARTAYVDTGRENDKRHLLRLWLSLE